MLRKEYPRKIDPIRIEQYIGSEVLTAVVTNVAIFLDIALCGPCEPTFQKNMSPSSSGLKISTQQDATHRLRAASLLGSCITLKMEVTRSSKTLVHIRATRRFTPEDSDRHSCWTMTNVICAGVCYLLRGGRSKPHLSIDMKPLGLSHSSHCMTQTQPGCQEREACHVLYPSYIHMLDHPKSTHSTVNGMYYALSCDRDQNCRNAR
jgi:hypothetical protein